MEMIIYTLLFSVQTPSYSPFERNVFICTTCDTAFFTDFLHIICYATCCVNEENDGGRRRKTERSVAEWVYEYYGIVLNNDNVNIFKNQITRIWLSSAKKGNSPYTISLSFL